MKHFTHPYLLNPQHPVTINLIGCGGTGSQVLTNLARMDFALRNLGHPGFQVTAFDPDTVSDANIGRQLFSPVEIGMNKATLLITKINRFFGLEWLSDEAAFDEKRFSPVDAANITISCVDTAASRVSIGKLLSFQVENIREHELPFRIPYYWIDFGNGRDFGQVVIGSIQAIKQPQNDFGILPTVIEDFPGLPSQDTEAIQGPSCSLAEALNKQDLFVNSALATLGCDLLWKMFREGGTEYRGLFMNLKSMKVNPIQIL